MFKSLYETEAQNAARLALAPVGSKIHTLSTMPINVHEWPLGYIIELPRTEPEAKPITVIPIAAQSGSREEQDVTPIRLNDVWWTCMVVASQDENYPARSNNLTIHGDELARGTVIEI